MQSSDHSNSGVHSPPTAFIGLYNPKSPTNVGAVLRAAGCYQADAVRYTGERFDRAAKYQTDTKNTLSKIPLTRVDDLLQDLPADMSVVCIELAEGAIPLPEFGHPERAIYIFGPEDGSIPQALMDRAQHVVYIATVGCMNLAATVNVVLYDRHAKTEPDIDHATRIKSSRDVRNHLRVKPPANLGNER